jgi:hypothetical protein
MIKAIQRGNWRPKGQDIKPGKRMFISLKNYSNLFNFLVLLVLAEHVSAEITIRWLRPDIEGRPYYQVVQHFQNETGIGLVIEYNDVVTPCLECDEIATLPFDVNGPAFVVERVDIPLSIPPNVRFLSLAEEEGWDPNSGSGWIQFPGLGYDWVYVRNYPWTWWLDQKDWRYIIYGGIVKEEESEGGYIHGGETAFWMWSLNDGWLWTTRRIFPWTWSLEQVRWLYMDDS